MIDGAAERGTPRVSRRAILSLGTAAAGALAGCTVADSAPAGVNETTQGKPVIDQWYHAYSEAGAREAVNRYAAAYPRATVTVAWRGGDYDSTTATAVRSGDGPDVFEYANGPTIDMIRDGLVVDLTDTVGAAQREFQQSILGRMTREGRIWGIPQVVDTQVLIYRRSMLDDAGLAPPSRSWTMDELIDAARALTTRDVKGLYLGNRRGATHLGGPTLWSAGLDYLTDDNDVGFDDPRAAEAFAKYAELHDSGAVLTQAPKDWFEPAALIDGLTAMQFTGLWTFPQLTEQLGDDFGVLPWPALDEMGNPSVPLGAYGACVSATAKDVEAAKDFVRWLWVEQADLQLDFATAYGLHIPSRTSLIDQADDLKSGPGAEAAAIALDYGVPQSKLLWTRRCASAFEAMMDAIIGGADPAAELKDLRTVVAAELKRVLA
jgi:multiple sugar transport system substrate-binding protein